MTRDEDAKEALNDAISMAKSLMSQYGEIPPMSYLLTLRKNVGAEEAAFIMPAGEDQESSILKGPEDEVVIIAIPPPSDAQSMLSILKTTTHDEELVAMILDLEEVAKAMHVPDPAEKILRQLLPTLKMTHKDVLLLQVTYFMKLVKAHAVVQVNQGWFRTCKPVKGATLEETKATLPENIDEDPEALEIIMASLETETEQTMTSIPIKREKVDLTTSDPRAFAEQRATGKVIGFGSPIVVETKKGDPKAVVSGRFYGLLEKAKNMPESVLDRLRAKKKQEERPQILH